MIPAYHVSCQGQTDGDTHTVIAADGKGKGSGDYSGIYLGIIIRVKLNISCGS